MLIASIGLFACGGTDIEDGAASATTQASGSTAILEWEASSSQNVVGYRIYYGNAPGTYLQPLGQGVNAGNATTFTVTGLTSGTRHYFVATAYDASNNESIYSNEVFKDMP